jgi:hypothetical protein
MNSPDLVAYLVFAGMFIVPSVVAAFVRSRGRKAGESLAASPIAAATLVNAVLFGTAFALGSVEYFADIPIAIALASLIGAISGCVTLGVLVFAERRARRSA